MRPRRPSRVRSATTGACLVAALGCTVDAGAPLERGLAPGFVLFSPLLSTTSYLVDRDGRVVHLWTSEFGPGAAVEMLPDGSLLRPGRQPGAPRFHDGGLGGRLQRIAWDGTLIWDWIQASERWIQHHDVEPLPNGNVLLLAWEFKSRQEALRAGRDPRRVGTGGLWPECVLEVRPRPPRDGDIVWEWHAWDHLVQERDPRLPHFASVRDHPERIDIDGGRGTAGWSAALLQRLQALGYLAGNTSAGDVEPDFMHANSVAYRPDRDEIVLSVAAFDEVWVIDHSTTNDESAGHAGGRGGHGGDLLYRWGNPQAYRRGGAGDRRLYGQHDARWIPPGRPGAGHLLVFNNGAGRPGGDWASVVELELPAAARGGYRSGPDGRFGPERPTWEYRALPPISFRAEFLSGAQRLPGGGTLVTAGPDGRFFEVDPSGATVWQYRNPFSGRAPNPAGDPPFAVFRAEFIPADHSALAGRELVPLSPQPRVGGG